MSIYIFLYLSISIYIYLSIIYLSIYLSVCLSIYLSTCKLENKSIPWGLFEIRKLKAENEAFLRDFLQIWKLTMSKTQQFSETFSKKRSCQHQKRSDLSFKTRQLSAELKASYGCVLRLFYPMSLKYCAYHEKVGPGHTKCRGRDCHAKSS